MSRATAVSGEYYCPPGAKFCPAPGADNTAFMSSYYGMDADTGEVTLYSGKANNIHADNTNLTTRESVILVAPNVSPENRYVPPATAFAPQPSYSAPAPVQTYQPQPYQQPHYAPVVPQAQPYPANQQQYANTTPPPFVRQSRPIQAVNAGRPEATSEVANQTSRKTRKETVSNDEKVPWWKGGMWRNKKDKDDAPQKTDSRKPNSGKGGKTAAKSPVMDDEDMWGGDNDEYSGYNSDGTFGRPAGGNAATARGPAPAAPADDPFSPPPFGGPAGGGYNNNYDPYAPNGNAYAGGGQPNYGGSPYDDTGTASFLGEPYTPPEYQGIGSPYATGGSVPYDGSYAAGQQYDAGQTYGGGYDASWGGGTDSWNTQPVQAVQSPFQATPSIDAQGSPQFENAVRMVKENRFTEAKSILSAETGRNPGNAAAWRWLADCHYNLLELDDAVTCYQRALDLDPNDYYALRGRGFSYLHRGHEYWRRMQEEVAQGQKDKAAATFAQAHDDYKKSLEFLGMCLRRAPNDGESIYGEAMAAEGASRKLYSNAISYLKLGPDQRERAELFAENCLTVINKGIERSKERAKLDPGEVGPRALMGGLYLRKAILFRQLGKNDLALMELRNSRDVQQSILDEIDKNNATAQRNLRECETYWEEWGGNRQ